MKTIKYFLVLVVSVLISQQAFSVRTYMNTLYDAYVNDKMDVWQYTMIRMENEYDDTRDAKLLLELTRAQYGYIAYLLADEKTDKAEDILKKAEKNADKLTNIKMYAADAYAMKGALLGFRMAISPYKAVYLGPRSLEYINKALSLNKYSPQVWLEEANAKYYTPEIFGGSKEKAIKAYENAIRLFEKNQQDSESNWLYLNTLTILAQSYTNTGQLDKAKATYEKILNIAPSFKWVKDELYPELLSLV